MLKTTGISGKVFASNRSVRLDVLYGGKLKIKNDILAGELLRQGEWDVKGVEYEILKANAGVSDDDIIAEIGLRFICRHEILAALAVLDSSEGAKVLQILEGENESEAILGYIGGQVVYLEHELEEGKEEEYHLHMKHKKLRWSRPLAVFIWK